MKQYDYVKTRREDVDEIPEKWVWLVRGITRFYTRLNIWVFKKSKGRLWKNFPGGYPICVVGMTGNKSGQRREIALIYLPYGDKVLLVASQGGLDKHPVWYHNISANPDVDVLFEGRLTKMHAQQASDDEKRELWPVLISIYPDFDQYQARTDRNIPVFICKPLG
jgi:deazaflavin-dependent oxidoreductase (nitroreductase family)